MALTRSSGCCPMLCRYEREFTASLAKAAVAEDVRSAKGASGPVKLLYDSRRHYELLASAHAAACWAGSSVVCVPAGNKCSRCCVSAGTLLARLHGLPASCSSHCCSLQFPWPHHGHAAVQAL